MRHFPLKELGYALGFVFLLALSYVGAFYAMVIPQRVWLTTIGPGGWIERESEIIANYRMGGEVSRAFFSLGCEMDRRIRPTVWWPELRHLNPD